MQINQLQVSNTVFSFLKGHTFELGISATDPAGVEYSILSDGNGKDW